MLLPSGTRPRPGPGRGGVGLHCVWDGDREGEGVYGVAGREERSRGPGRRVEGSGGGSGRGVWGKIQTWVYLISGGHRSVPGTSVGVLFGARCLCGVLVGARYLYGVLVGPRCLCGVLEGPPVKGFSFHPSRSFLRNPGFPGGVSGTIAEGEVG